MLSLTKWSRTFWSATLVACTAHGSQAQVTLQIEALEDPILLGPALVGSHGPATKEIDIAFGDILALRIDLKNEEDTESQPMPLGLGPRAMRAILVVIHPDGRETLSQMNDPRVRAAPPPVRPMKPREQLEATLYGYSDYAAEIDGRFEYLFPNPGQYHVYVAYAYRRSPTPQEDNELPVEKADHSVSDGESIATRTLHHIKHRDTHIVSNTVRVNVGQSFPGWEELRDAGIVAEVRGVGGFAAIRLERNVNWRTEINRLDALIAEADRPWLTAFYARVKADALELAPDN